MTKKSTNKKITREISNASLAKVSAGGPGELDWIDVWERRFHIDRLLPQATVLYATKE